MFEDDNYKNWINIVREALSCLDFETYTWKFLPTSGGYYEQDEFIITIWEYIKYSYLQLRQDKIIIEAMERKRAKS